MAVAKLKEQHKSTFVAFGGGGSRLLGQRDDLDKLALMAVESGDKSLLSLFEAPLPSADELRKSITDSELRKGLPEQNKPADADTDKDLLDKGVSPDPNAKNKRERNAGK
jgi:hypothetical protein